MKIRGWSIDGFGLFHDCAIADLPDGLTVLHGSNEAGKSTLLEFLRRVLFGVPAGEAGPSYAPLHGGRHRGRVVVADGDGEVVVERELDRRAPAVLRRPDGRAVDPDELHRLLGGADERLFRSVFAFSLDDLQSLATLDTAGVREALFSASLAGAGRSARAAAQALRAHAAAQLDGEGPAQVNRLIGELNALRPRLNEARRAVRGYADQAAGAERLAAAVDAQRAALAARRAARGRDEALLRAWPAWQALHAARAELDASGPVAEVADDTEVQLRAARERLTAAQGALHALRAEQAAAEPLAAVPAADDGAATAAEIEALVADLPLHRFQLATLPAARARCAEAQQLLDERLQRAGAEWTAERLREWSRAAVDRDAVRDWQVRLRAAAERVQQAQWRLEAAAGRREAARRDRDLAAAELSASTALGAAEVDRQRQALTEVRAALEEMLARRAQGESTAQALQERERALRGLEAERDPAPPVWLPTVLALAAAGSAVVALWALGSDALLGGLAATASAGAAGGAARWAALRRRAHAQREEQRQAGRRALRSEMEAARRRRDAEWHRAAELAEQIARQAGPLGLPRVPSAPEIDAREHALVDAAAADARAALVRARSAELEQVLRDREAEERARTGDAAAAAEVQQGVAAQWTAWAAAAGFPAAAAPDAVLDHVAALEAARAAQAALDAAERELRQVEPMVLAWEARARALLGRVRAAGGFDLSAHALIERVLALRLRVQEESAQRARRAALADEQRARAGRLSAAVADVEQAQAAIAAILRAAGARDDADLARLRALAERRRALQRAVAEHERALRGQVGVDAGVATVSAEAIDACRQRAAAADEEIAGLEQQLYQLIAEQHDARAACRALEESSEVPALETEWAALMAELGEAVHEWRVLAAAEGLLDEARQSFERTRQPAVLRAASTAFAVVTGGRYERVAQDESGQALVVVERGGRRKPVGSELSRGTTEQLYLSIRLGLAQELARRGIALPLVMDDVLVHFDPDRARAMTDVLAASAREQQVLFFTCHPATRDLLVHHGQAARLIEL